VAVAFFFEILYREGALLHISKKHFEEPYCSNSGGIAMHRSKKYKKGKLLYEGKTKRIYEVMGYPHFVIIENKDDITKNDDPNQTRKMKSKAKIATKTTCLIFEILQKEGIPVAYIEQISDTEFVALKTRMVGLELIERRYPVGSFINRHPAFKGEEAKPHRFSKPIFEAFLKTTGGKIVSYLGEHMGSLPKDGETGRVIDDPFISNPYDPLWSISHPKMVVDSEGSQLCTLFATDILPPEISMQLIKEMVKEAFLTIENLFKLVSIALVDFKVEVGMDSYGRLVISDVIDNDSWRLRTLAGWRELSKELFRQNKDMKEIEEAYEFVLIELTRAVEIYKNL